MRVTPKRILTESYRKWVTFPVGQRGARLSEGNLRHPLLVIGHCSPRLPTRAHFECGFSSHTIKQRTFCMVRHELDEPLGDKMLVQWNYT
jgi:hypothetical protein